MAKIIAKIPCDKPDCTHPHEMEIDYEEPKLPKATTTIQTTSPSTQTVQVMEEKLQEKIIEKIPSYLPKYKCKNCDSNHKNPNYTQRPKGKCSNCDQFSKDSSGKCPWCDKEEIEPIDEDDLDELGIPMPDEHEHKEE